MSSSVRPSEDVAGGLALSHTTHCPHDLTSTLLATLENRVLIPIPLRRAPRIHSNMDMDALLSETFTGAEILSTGFHLSHFPNLPLPPDAHVGRRALRDGVVTRPHLRLKLAQQPTQRTQAHALSASALPPPQPALPPPHLDHALPFHSDGERDR